CDSDETPPDCVAIKCVNGEGSPLRQLNLAPAPAIPDSRKLLLCGDRGLKNGPSVSAIVGSSSSWQAGVGARLCWPNPSRTASIKPVTANAPVERIRRRDGKSSLDIGLS